MLTDEQRAARREGIGGSDAAVVLGVSKWKSSYELWCEKTAKLDPRDQPEGLRPVNKAMSWGNRLESVVLDAFVEERGIAVPYRDVQIVHRQHSFILGSLDGLASDGCPVEVKTSKYADDWGDSGSAEIPDHYYPQVQHYIGLYPNAHGAHVAALIGGNDLRTYFVPRDEQFISDLFLLETDFWLNHVVAGVAPEPTSLPGMTHRYRYDDGSALEVESDLAMQVADLKDIRSQITVLEQREEDMKLGLMLKMRDAQVLTYQGRAIASWKTRNGAMRFDTNSFKVQHPALYKQFARQGAPTRPFLPK